MTRQPWRGVTRFFSRAAGRRIERRSRPRDVLARSRHPLGRRDTSFGVATCDGPRVSAILRLGDPRLRAIARPVDLAAPEFPEAVARLHRALADFRAEHGFGRAIAAPQLGIDLRLVAMNLGDGPRTLVNPEIVRHSDETFTLWDDCMCFPELLVRVRRWTSISIKSLDEEGRLHLRERLPRNESELLQHELDHLDGVLAVDRADGPDAIVTRVDHDREPGRYATMVDR
ncbi:peptide deformylase [Nannocystis poenicansa]|uniref:Peptide deformylase n=2 Tax=Nannocystis punicea TaxID=2995304 RepID=A0ABY7HJP9_9BACT|nr:peptide deformylase [Nannocystis poenicansa]